MLLLVKQQRPLLLLSSADRCSCLCFVVAVSCSIFFLVLMVKATHPADSKNTEAPDAGGHIENLCPSPFLPARFLVRPTDPTVRAGDDTNCYLIDFKFKGSRKPKHGGK